MVRKIYLFHHIDNAMLLIHWWDEIWLNGVFFLCFFCMCNQSVCLSFHPLLFFNWLSNSICTNDSARFHIQLSMTLFWSLRRKFFHDEIIELSFHTLTVQKNEGIRIVRQIIIGQNAKMHRNKWWDLVVAKILQTWGGICWIYIGYVGHNAHIWPILSKYFSKVWSG